MKLVYFYIRSYGCLQDRGFLFDARYSVKVEKKNNEFEILVKETGDKLDNILYGNVSVTAIVGDNGTGKSTCLDALQAWLVDFDNNPGFVILEDGEKLLYQSNPRCKVKIKKNGIKLKKFEGEELALNAIFFSDVLDDRMEVRKTPEEGVGGIRRVRFYKDISTCAIIDTLTEEGSNYSFLRQLHMNDSFLQIKLLDRTLTNNREYPWGDIVGERYLNFQIIDYDDHFVRPLESAWDLNQKTTYLKIISYINREEKHFNERDIIRETLFLDYVGCLFRSVNILCNDVWSIVNEIIDRFFSIYWEDNKENYFLENVFCRFDQDNYLEKEKKIKERFFSDSEVPNFEIYIELYLQLMKMSWITEGLKEYLSFMQSIQELTDRSNRLITIGIPKGESLESLYNIYMEAQTSHDFLKFTWDMSSGEKSICILFARIYEVIENIRKRNPDEKSYLLMVDEIDNLYHPKWQQKIVNWIVQFLNSVFPWYKFQIIITTHSPVLLSDIPENRVIFMLKDKVYKTEIQKHNETFAANIATLYYDAFFMHEGSIGEMAKKTVDMLYEVLSNELDQEQDDFNNKIIIPRYVIPQTQSDIINNQDILYVKMSSILKRRYPSNYINKMGISENNAAEIISQIIDIVGEDIWREQLRVMYNKYFTLGNTEEMAAHKIQKLLSQFSPQQKEAILKRLGKNDSNN